MLKALTATGLLILLQSTLAFSADQAPPCLAYGRELPVNNQQVAHWRRTTANQFTERGHVAGPVVKVFPDKNGHDHFVISIGNNPDDVLEVIYNQSFGAIPNVELGMMIEACGDYITSTAQSGPYPPSPAGAIIHWIHMNPKGRGHLPGFLMINGTLYGQDASNAGPKPYPNQKPRPKRPKHGRHFEEMGYTMDAYFSSDSYDSVEEEAPEYVTE